MFPIARSRVEMWSSSGRNLFAVLDIYRYFSLSSFFPRKLSNSMFPKISIEVFTYDPKYDKNC